VHGVPLLVYLYITGPNTFIYEKALQFVNPDCIKTILLIAISLMYVFLIFGCEIANLSFPRWKRRADFSGLSSLQLPLLRIVEITVLQKIILWMILLSMLVVSLEQGHLSNVVNFYQFEGSEIEKTIFRRDFGGTPYYFYNVILYSVAPFLVMVSYCSDVGHKNSKFPSIFTIALFFVVLLGKTATLSKAPPVIFILQLLFFRVMMNNSIMNIKIFIAFWFSGGVLFFIITRFTFPNLNVFDSLKFLYYRTFDIPNEVLLEYFAAIPSAIPHSWGHSIFDLFSGRHTQGDIQAYYAVAEVTRNSLLSTSNSMFVGDAWAQFSWLGVCFFSFVAGFCVRFIDLYGRRRGHTDMYACLVAGCAFGIFTILSTAFTTGLVTGGLALIPLISTLFVRSRDVATAQIFRLRLMEKTSQT
jgi:hypothetical protein